MAWNPTKSEKRIKERKSSNTEYKVTEHTKEMDFQNLGPKDIRKVDGIHHYFDISNFPALADGAKEDESKQKKLLQKAHIFRRGLEDLLKDSDAQIIQGQNLRTHFLRTKPYSDKTKMCETAIIEGITLNSFVYDVFNNVFSDTDNFRARSGMAIGITYIANIGKTGNRELISLGDAANYGAKLLSNDGSLSISETIYALVSDNDIKDIFTKEKLPNGVAYYLAKQAKWSVLTSLKEKYSINFDEEKIKKSLEEYKSSLPLSDITVSDARTKISFEDLSESNAKRTHTVSGVADIDGFTKYITEAEKKNTIPTLFALFTAIREELHTVIEDDFEGTVVQHRGDATYFLINMPCGKDEKETRMNNATSLALAIQSSMKRINEIYEEYKDLKISIGLGSGVTIYSRVGIRSDKHLAIVGKGNEESESCQHEAKGGETFITKLIFDSLEKDLSLLFEGKDDLFFSNKNIESSYDTKEESQKLEKNLIIDTSAKKISITTSDDRSAQQHVNQGKWHP